MEKVPEEPELEVAEDMDDTIVEDRADVAEDIDDPLLREADSVERTHQPSVPKKEEPAAVVEEQDVADEESEYAETDLDVDGKHLPRVWRFF